MLIFHWNYVQMCQGDSGRPRVHFGEGSEKVRARFGEGSGKVRARFGTAAGEPAPDPHCGNSLWDYYITFTRTL